MPPLKLKDVCDKLETKFGFTRTRRRDHREFELVVEGVVVARTYVSHKAKGTDLGNPLVAQMAKQVGVPTKDFRAMIQCSISREQYVSRMMGPY